MRLLFKLYDNSPKRRSGPGSVDISSEARGETAMTHRQGGPLRGRPVRALVFAAAIIGLSPAAAPGVEESISGVTHALLINGGSQPEH